MQPNREGNRELRTHAETTKKDCGSVCGLCNKLFMMISSSGVLFTMIVTVATDLMDVAAIEMEVALLDSVVVLPYSCPLDTAVGLQAALLFT